VTQEVGVYIHVPFCRKRCPYCAFVLIESDGSLHDRFVDKICREIRAAKPKARTLYFGGGTPSMLGAAPIRRMIEAEDSSHPLSDQEIADALAADGVALARRTVAKYRDELQILPARLRHR